MAQNITLLGASYTGVPGVELPKTGGGTALFADPSVTTAVEADVAQGKIFLKADGSTGTGTATGGGGTGGVTQDQDGYIVLDDQPGGGGGGIPATLIKTLTVPENVNSFQFEWDSALDAYDVVYMMMDFELTASDWLYYHAGSDSETYGLSHTQHKFGIVCSKQDTTGTSKRIYFPSNRVQNISIGTVVVIRTYVATKYIKAGSNIACWGFNYADL